MLRTQDAYGREYIPLSVMGSKTDTSQLFGRSPIEAPKAEGASWLDYRARAKIRFPEASQEVRYFDPITLPFCRGVLQLRMTNEFYAGGIRYGLNVSRGPKVQALLLVTSQ